MLEQEKNQRELLQELAELRQEVARLKAIEKAYLELKPHLSGKEQAEAKTSPEQTETDLMPDAADLEDMPLFLDSVIENLPTMLFVKDAKELRFVRWNKAAEALTGFTREEFMGKNDYDFFPKKEADFFIAKDRQVLNEGKLLDIPEETIQTKHRGARILHTRKIPLFGPDGKPKYLLGISEDITERKQAELERERLLAEVESTYRQYIRREWAQFLSEQSGGVQIAYETQPLPSSTEVLEPLQRQVIEQGQIKMTTGAPDNGHSTEPLIVAPIALRGEVIGTLSLQDNAPERKWTAEEITLVETVSEQLALTLENLRLYEETQRAAWRDQVISETTAKVWSSAEIEEVMRAAVAQLGDKLRASEVVIRLGTETQINPE